VNGSALQPIGSPVNLAVGQLLTYNSKFSNYIFYKAKRT
jgi:hypothetical protein